VPAHPLTHHEILGLIEPFTRRGRHRDLAASNRLERRLVFKPLEHVEQAAPCPALRATLALDNIEEARYRLTRVLALPDGLEASLEAEGSDPAALLALIESVDRQRQFRIGERFAIAQSHRIDAQGSAMNLRLTRALARVAALSIGCTMPTISGVPASLTVMSPAADTLNLPEDLLAVLGWDWCTLHRSGEGWKGSLAVRRRESARSRQAETQFERTVAHLARTLEETPAQFHYRLRAARWSVAPRRSVPLLVCLGIIAAASCVSRLGLAQNSPIRMLIFNAPPLRAGARHRLPWEPGITPSKSVPRLVVIVDVSGSIEDSLLERFAREIEAITRRLEAGLVLVIGDDQVRHVVQCEPGRSNLRAIEFKGRGGTDFTPLLEEADRHHPDIGVVLTDLQGPARFRPRWPVLWAVPEAFAHAVQPFGRRLRLA
jgi:hypothetical protein